MKHLYILLLLVLPQVATSQTQHRAVGMRGGYTGGFTFRVHIEQALSYEAQFGYREQGAVFTLFRQLHRDMGMDRNGNWDFIHGYGLHAGFYFTDSYRILYREVYFGRDIFTPVLGIDGFLGVEYQLVDLPVSFGLTLQPYMELSLRQVFGISLWDLALTVNYRF